MSRASCCFFNFSVANENLLNELSLEELQAIDRWLRPLSEKIIPQYSDSNPFFTTMFLMVIVLGAAAYFVKEDSDKFLTCIILGAAFFLVGVFDCLLRKCSGEAAEAAEARKDLMDRVKTRFNTHSALPNMPMNMSFGKFTDFVRNTLREVKKAVVAKEQEESKATTMVLPVSQP